jgi:hypothetical protein
MVFHTPYSPFTAVFDSKGCPSRQELQLHLIGERRQFLDQLLRTFHLCSLGRTILRGSGRKLAEELADPVQLFLRTLQLLLHAGAGRAAWRKGRNGRRTRRYALIGNGVCTVCTRRGACGRVAMPRSICQPPHPRPPHKGQVGVKVWPLHGGALSSPEQFITRQPNGHVFGGQRQRPRHRL